MRRDRLESIQALRGIAAVLIVLQHTMHMTNDQAGAGSSLFVGLFRNTGFAASGVDLFFVISGFVMSASLDHATGRHGIRNFLWRRFLRIVPLFWIMSCVFLDLKSFAGEGPTRDSVMNTIFFLPILDTGRYDLPILPVGWTLTFEFLFYAIVAGALALPVPRRHALVVVVLSVLAFTGLVCHPTLLVAAVGVNPILFEFLFGVLIQRLALRDIGKRSLIAVAFALGLLGLCCSTFGISDFNMDPWVTIEAKTSLARVFAWGVPWAMVVLACAKMRNRAGFLTLLGDASYSIYLSHMIVLMIISKGWSVQSWIPADLMILVSVPLAVGMGMLTFWFVEKPLARQLSRSGEQAKWLPASRRTSAV